MGKSIVIDRVDLVETTDIEKLVEALPPNFSAEMTAILLISLLFNHK